MRNVGATRIIFKRELASYFATPLALVFIVIFLVLGSSLTFFVNGFYERQQADLLAFFDFHPWLYLFLAPAISMSVWADERKTGNIELLMTLPISLSQTVVGKFLAAWAFAGITLALTFPMWITVNYSGSPDNGAIFAGYIGSFLMAGGFLAIGACISASTRNVVIAFLITLVVCFGLLMAGHPMVLNFVPSFMPQWLVDVVASLSVWAHFDAIKKGVVDLRDLIYFAALISVWLVANAIVLDMKKAD